MEAQCDSFFRWLWKSPYWKYCWAKALHNLYFGFAAFRVCLCYWYWLVFVEKPTPNKYGFKANWKDSFFLELSSSNCVELFSKRKSNQEVTEKVTESNQ